MSIFFKPTTALHTWWRANDQRLVDTPNLNPYFNSNMDAPWTDAQLWPTSRGMGGVCYFGNDASGYNRWGAMPKINGNAGMLKFIGTTKDNNGNNLGSCVVQVFLTANDQIVSEMISDSAGYFEATTRYAATNHYLVCYKAGSPDVTGASLNTLQPV